MTKLMQGKLETEIMNLIWEKKDCSPKEVLNALDHQLALTTVSTILDRLAEKGLLKKHKQGGRVRYIPKVSQEMYGQNMVKQFFGKMISSFGEQAIPFFAKGVEKLPKSKKDELTQLLKSYEDK